MQSKSYYPNPAGLRHALICACMLLFAPGLYAQLSADFSVDRTSGCAPFTVIFSNKTKGASPQARYAWNFGNGNTSALQSPGATFRTAQTYTVTLTVTDKGVVATKSQQITVYKNPEVAFSVSAAKGCLPLQVDFRSTATAGDGNIASYLWDFGDGAVKKGEDAVRHTYNFAQKASVSLTVTNQYGCFTTIEKPAAVNVLPAVKADFSADKTLLCSEGEAVQFTNKSTGATGLTYQWNFGDQKASTAADPKHIYEEKGTYSVGLKVSSPDGCTAEKVVANQVNVGQLTATMQVPQVVCVGTQANLKAAVQPAADSIVWTLDDNRRMTGASINATFATPGLRTVRFVAYSGGCAQEVAKEVLVQSAPVVKGFIKDASALCQLPAALNLKDTTTGATKWQWKIGNLPVVEGRQVAPNITEPGIYGVQLSVTGATGCVAVVKDTVLAGKPDVTIRAVNAAGSGTEGCIGMALNFSAVSNVAITDYKWDFGDGNTASGATPKHVFNKSGRFTVTLQYTTAGGCLETVSLPNVAVYSKPKIDFVGPKGACGSNPVGFTATTDTAVMRYYWYYGENTKPQVTTSPNTDYKFMDPGLHTIKLVANNGVCADSVIKKDFIKLTPPFQYMEKALVDCIGDRKTVSFPVFVHAERMTWDFGDGTTQTIDAPALRKVYPLKHTYGRPGYYKAVYKSYMDGCEARDSVSFYVSPKEQPSIALDKSMICPTDTLGIEVTVQVPAAGFTVHKLLYADGSAFTGKTSVVATSDKSKARILAWGFDGAKKGLRAIIQWNVSNCFDTSALVDVRYSTLNAKISVAKKALCLGEPVLVSDASIGKVNKWEWDFGNGNTKVLDAKAPVSFSFDLTGYHPVQLRVTNEDGCVGSARLDSIKVIDVTAGFSMADTVVGINTAAIFTNTSKAFPESAMQYQWWYEGSTKTAKTTNLSYTYKETGVDTIKLVARTNGEGCTDTLVKSFKVVNFNARFTYTAAYINDNACPPMLVKFKNLSKGTSKNLWHFGDGSTAQNVDLPEHVYRSGGTYTVTLYTYGAQNRVDSASEEIVVKGPSAKLSADKFFGCLDQRVTLSAEVESAKNFYWDFGDGTVLHTRDTFARHHYQTAGVYRPALVMSDSLGCSVGVGLPNPIIIDSLAISIQNNAALLCDAGKVSFSPNVVSVAADELGQKLAYRWHTTTASDTTSNPQFNFAGAGKHVILLTTTSPYGCTQQTTDTIIVQQTVKGAIEGKGEVCVNSGISFLAKTPQTVTSMRWLMPDGVLGNETSSPVQQFAKAGTYPVKLVVNNHGCLDTATLKLQVHGLPEIQLKRRSESICLGQSVQLQAAGGVSYKWEGVVSALGEQTVANPVIAPVQNMWYRVFVKNAQGCENKDSVFVKVHQPFKMEAPKTVVVCAGSETILEAKGAATYHWSGPAGTLATTTGSQVKAKPFATAPYTVVGTDSAHCFTDTAIVKVQVAALPSVKTGPDQTLLTGSEITLSAKGSNDVVSYQWYPADYLNCATCPQTVATPRKAIDYTVTVRNNFGCIASDTIRLSLQCTDSRIFIPNAFTPDQNGLNETFSVRGRGVTIVKSMRIFDRWGGVVFQSNNTGFEDRSGAWDGNIGGKKAPVGTYVYVTELICDTGELIVKKGTVTLIR
ncbi:PKD domain-containing protein [Paracnuella aquatica]|nr:PKD domain-containing protein [Paracnuella aquatica]